MAKSVSKYKGGGRNKRNKLKQYKKDHDQVKADIESDYRPSVDEDKPGFGRFYCQSCHRYFVNSVALGSHQKTGSHKRLLKLMLTEPYSDRDAAQAAEMGYDKRE